MKRLTFLRSGYYVDIKRIKVALFSIEFNMTNKIIGIGVSLGLFLTTGPTWAVPNFLVLGLQTPGTSGTLTLPEPADNSPVLIPLGERIDPGSGRLVEGYAIIHYKDGNAKPEGKPGKGGGTACYAFFANGAKWRTVEPWLMNSSNASSLDGTTVFNTQAAALAKWEDAADGTVGSGLGVDIVGTGLATTSALVADTESPDNQNEVYFADVSTADAIAVTIVWGIFGGPPWARELVEWDQVYDDVDYDWSLNGAAGTMDFDNIATHEDGHTVGLADIYDSTCGAVTMYGYADYGETNKRTLEPADILGVSTLY